MHITFFKGMKDNVVRPEDTFELSWDELVRSLTTLTITNVKNAEAFIIGQFNLDPSTALPAGAKSPPLKKGTIGRYHENLITQDALCLDFDEGPTIEQIQQDLEGLTHFGYTSFSHGTTQFSRCRVVVQLKEPVPIENWLPRTHHVLALFRGLDKSTTSRARIFYTHACPAERVRFARSWQHQGEPLDYNGLEALLVPPAPLPVPLASTSPSGTGKVRWETFDALRFLKDNGYYIRAINATTHAIRCPNLAAHTRQDPSGTVVYLNGRSGPVWQCGHSHCNPESTKVLSSKFAELHGKAWKVPYCEREVEPVIIMTKAAFYERLLKKQGETKQNDG